MSGVRRFLSVRDRDKSKDRGIHLPGSKHAHHHDDHVNHSSSIDSHSNKVRSPTRHFCTCLVYIDYATLKILPVIVCITTSLADMAILSLLLLPWSILYSLFVSNAQDDLIDTAQPPLSSYEYKPPDKSLVSDFYGLFDVTDRPKGSEDFEVNCHSLTPYLLLTSMLLIRSKHCESASWIPNPSPFATRPFSGPCDHKSLMVTPTLPSNSSSPYQTPRRA